MAEENTTITTPTDEQAPVEETKKEEIKEEVKEESKVETKEVEVPDKFKKLVEEIEKMSVLDLSELVKILEDKFGVSAAAPMAMMGVVAGGGAEAVEEKDSVDVELTAAGDNKIGVIKVVREITQKGLKEAKDLVDGAPQIVKEGAKKAEAEEIKKKIEEAGGKVTLK
jgi:large subunit ribosomal protein L7/L12